MPLSPLPLERDKNRPVLAPPARPRTPVLTARERAAYAVAHRIVQADLKAPWRIVTPGARQSWLVDEIARMILEGMR